MIDIYKPWKNILPKKNKGIDYYRSKIIKKKIAERERHFENMVRFSYNEMITAAKRNLPYIKPCPFCGGEAVLYGRDIDDSDLDTLVISDTGKLMNPNINLFSLVIKCTICGVEKETDTIYSCCEAENKAAIEFAINQWNRRVREGECIDAEFKEEEKEW